jgi:hypothetical protein
LIDDCQSKRGIEMPHGALDYAKRAAECVRLANLTIDEMVQGELLRLRQVYLRTAERLGMPMHEAIPIPVERKPDEEWSQGELRLALPSPSFGGRYFQRRLDRVRIALLWWVKEVPGVSLRQDRIEVRERAPNLLRRFCCRIDRTRAAPLSGLCLARFEHLELLAQANLFLGTPVRKVVKKFF